MTTPGTPVIRYGDAIGMGEDLCLPEQTAIRTPMQWAPSTIGGFSHRGARSAGAPGLRPGRVTPP